MSPQRISARRRRQHEATQRQATQDLTKTMVADGHAETARRAAAVAVDRAELSAAEIQAWQADLTQRLATIQQHPEQNLGFIEEEMARATRAPLRLLAERAAQAKANAVPCHCPTCHRELRQTRVLRCTVESRFGPLTIYRPYGWCAACDTWHFPADLVLGLHKNSKASPYLQEVCALLHTKMPSEQAVDVAARFGLDLARCFIHREAHRQGVQAQALRQDQLGQLDTWAGLQGVAGPRDGADQRPFTLIIEIDAWNIRERDDWGQTAAVRATALREQKSAPSKWHWVYVGTIFRLDHCGQTAGGRALISQRAYACTRLGLEELTRQLHYQALRCGLGEAQEVLVIADGATWIWKLVADRFPQARCRLDLYHGDEHLWAIANELYGKGTPEARRWIEPVLQQLRQDDGVAVIQSLQEVTATVGDKLREKVQAQITYFENNRDRLDYRAILAARQAVTDGTATADQHRQAAEPLGSGAIESTCRQYQVRFKRTGQFWSRAGDEALLCLETFWRNGRWHDLFPHAQPPTHANN